MNDFISNTIDLDDDDYADEREMTPQETEMFLHIHKRGTSILDLPADLGSPDDWLHMAMLHLKVMDPTENSAGMVTVSNTAISILQIKIEELLHGGSPLQIPLPQD
jgi:hypothetical protein